MHSAAQQLEAADALAELWKGLLPEQELPDRAQFLTWAAMCPEETAVFALNRAARKARNQKIAGDPLDGERLGRYITGIIRNEREGRHIFNNEGRNAA
jgi:hypothetical protein